mgnify:CR=1 FL=1
MSFFSPKTWKQRIVEFPGRRRLDDTSTADVYDVSRAEGNITQEGDGFTAANMNDLEQRITEGFQNVQNKTDELTQNLNTEYEKILEITELTGSGAIPGFSNYKEFVIVISASGYVASHYLVKNMLTHVNLHSSYYYDSAQHAMAAIRIDPNGTYVLAPGMEQNSQNSSVVIYAR